VYGALPAETRRAQARLFNDPDGVHKVWWARWLAASGLVGRLGVGCGVWVLPALEFGLRGRLTANVLALALPCSLSSPHATPPTPTPTPQPTQVLIASDAIGLGLNFNIRRVVFSTLTKSMGQKGRRAAVPPSLIKQIAGRAGRRNRCGGADGVC